MESVAPASCHAELRSIYCNAIGFENGKWKMENGELAVTNSTTFHAETINHSPFTIYNSYCCISEQTVEFVAPASCHAELRSIYCNAIGFENGKWKMENGELAVTNSTTFHTETINNSPFTIYNSYNSSLSLRKTPRRNTAHKFHNQSH